MRRGHLAWLGRLRGGGPGICLIFGLLVVLARLGLDFAGKFLIRRTRGGRTGAGLCAGLVLILAGILRLLLRLRAGAFRAWAGRGRALRRSVLRGWLLGRLILSLAAALLLLLLLALPLLRLLLPLAVRFLWLRLVLLPLAGLVWLILFLLL